MLLKMLTFIIKILQGQGLVRPRPNVGSKKQKKKPVGNLIFKSECQC